MPVILCGNYIVRSFSASSSDDLQGLGSVRLPSTKSGHPNLWDIHLTHCPGKAPGIVRVFFSSWRRMLVKRQISSTAKCKDPPRGWIQIGHSYRTYRKQFGKVLTFARESAQDPGRTCPLLGSGWQRRDHAIIALHSSPGCTIHTHWVYTPPSLLFEIFILPWSTSHQDASLPGALPSSQ